MREPVTTIASSSSAAGFGGWARLSGAGSVPDCAKAGVAKPASKSVEAAPVRKCARRLMIVFVLINICPPEAARTPPRHLLLWLRTAHGSGTQVFGTCRLAG